MAEHTRLIRTTIEQPTYPGDVAAVLRTAPAYSAFREHTALCLPRGRYVVGRDSGPASKASILVALGLVSLEHATLEISDEASLTDMQSSNGTFVNGVRVARWQLKDGDCILLRPPQDGTEPDPLRTMLWVHLGAAALRLAEEASPIPRAATPMRTQTFDLDEDAEHDRFELALRYLEHKYGGPERGVVQSPRPAGFHALDPSFRVAGWLAKAVDHRLHVQFRATEDELIFQLVRPPQVDERVLTNSMTALSDTVGRGDVSRAIAVPASVASGAVRDAAALPAARSPRRDTEPALVRVHQFIHISDMHWGAPSGEHDHRRVHAALVRDVESHRHKWRRSETRVLMTGDVAYSGQRHEYDAAFIACEQLTKAAGLGLEHVRITVGNHDVDRKAAAEPLAAAVHQYVRSSLEHAERALGSDECRNVLLRKHEQVLRFLARFPGHAHALDWREDLGNGISLAGLATTWASDAGDRGPPQHGGSLVVTQHQLAVVAPPNARDRLRVIMMHHPREWLTSDSAQQLARVVARVPSIQFCGHVHGQEGVARTRFGAPAREVTLNAGAAHLGRGEGQRHSYSLARLHEMSDGSVRLGWSPRVYVPQADEFRLDPAHTRSPDGYEWMTICHGPGDAPDVVVPGTDVSSPPPPPRAW